MKTATQTSTVSPRDFEQKQSELVHPFTAKHYIPKKAKVDFEKDVLHGRGISGFNLMRIFGVKLLVFGGLTSFKGFAKKD